MTSVPLLRWCAFCLVLFLSSTNALANKSGNQKKAKRSKQMAVLLKIILSNQTKIEALKNNAANTKLISSLKKTVLALKKTVLALKKQACRNQTGLWAKKKQKCFPALKLSSQKMTHDSIDIKNTCGYGWHVAGVHEGIIRYYLDPLSRRSFRPIIEKLKLRRTWFWALGNGAHPNHYAHPYHGSSVDYTHNSHPNSKYKATACKSGTWPVVHLGALGRKYKPMADCADRTSKRYVLCARDVK